MTTYNPVNGTWTAGNYDLTTVILREEWGFTGFVMSDWYARTKFENFERSYGGNHQNLRDYIPCVEAQNDIYMCCRNIANFKTLNVYEGLESGQLARAFMQRNAINICNYLMNSTAMNRFLSMSSEDVINLLGELEKGELLFESAELPKDNEVIFDCKQDGRYILETDIICEGTHLSQSTAIFYANGGYITSFTVVGANGRITTDAKFVTLKKGENRITVKHPDKVLSIASVRVFEERG